jgi:hypothetical protein
VDNITEPVEPAPTELIEFVAPVAPYDLPFLEVGLYVYKKLDAALPAAWSNSGVQDFITAVPGDAWFTEFPGELPAYVCGPGWAVQQDKVSHYGTFVWPESIEYPNDNIGWPPIYAAQHTDLEAFVMVPDCLTVPPVEVTPPPVEVVPRELAATGAEWVLVAAVAFALLALGVAFLAARRFAAPVVTLSPSSTGMRQKSGKPKYRRSSADSAL